MNKKMMIIGAGAALLLGSVAVAQTTSNSSTPSDPSGANSASQNGANSSATTPDNSATSANSAGSNASATTQAGERG
jgi:hypothetical protein